MPTPHSAYGANSEDLHLLAGGTLIRKTSLQDRTDNPLRSSKRLTKHSIPTCDQAKCRECVPDGLRPFQYSERSSLHDVRYHAPPQFSRAFSSRESIVRTDTNFISSDELSKPDWWSQTGSNRRPPACKAGALPAELWPLVGFGWLANRSSRITPRLRFSSYAGQSLTRFASEDWWAWEDLNFRPHAYQARALTN